MKFYAYIELETQQGDLIDNLICKDNFQNSVKCLKLAEQTDFHKACSMQGLFFLVIVICVCLGRSSGMQV